MKREDVKQYDLARLSDGRDGVIVEFWGNGPMFEFEFSPDADDKEYWEQETCDLADVVEILDSLTKK